jgi:UDP-2-acetamido-3-amino-2,3-dideoxy-glucuronate N-acetyltransferase
MENYFVHPSSIVDEGAKIGSNTKIWHFCHISSNVEIGHKCILGQNVFVAGGVKIGNGVKIQNNVSLYTGVILEDDVFLGPSVVFTNVMNPRSFIERKNEYKPTIVHKGASIGANATIVCGTTLGEYCFIGAGAVVTKNVLPFQLMAGCPAKPIGWISKNGHKLNMEKHIGICPETQEIYALKDGHLFLLENKLP